MDLMVLSDATVGISIGLFERLGAFVVDFDMGSDFAGEIGVESEDAAGWSNRQNACAATDVFGTVTAVLRSSYPCQRW